jgi:hypothetical protein
LPHGSLTNTARIAAHAGYLTDSHQQQDTDASTAVLEMYQLLGLWLCSYWTGTPWPNLWEDVAELAMNLGGYPGGAFYDKLGGDVYKYQRRRREKLASVDKLLPKGESQEKIFVVAYSPLLLLPNDERDLVKVPNEFTPFRSPISEFCHCVEKLGRRFLRYQAWRYIRDEHPITYIVSRGSASRALMAIASAKVDVETPSITGKERSDRILLELELVKERSNDLVKSLSPTKVLGRQLMVVDSDVMRGKGLTSCILSAEVGAVANRPHRIEQPAALCY